MARRKYAKERMSKRKTDKAAMALSLPTAAYVALRKARYGRDTVYVIRAGGGADTGLYRVTLIPPENTKIVIATIHPGYVPPEGRGF